MCFLSGPSSWWFMFRVGRHFSFMFELRIIFYGQLDSILINGVLCFHFRASHTRTCPSARLSPLYSVRPFGRVFFDGSLMRSFSNSSVSHEHVFKNRNFVENTKTNSNSLLKFANFLEFTSPAKKK